MLKCATVFNGWWPMAEFLLIGPIDMGHKILKTSWKKIVIPVYAYLMDVLYPVPELSVLQNYPE